MKVNTAAVKRLARILMKDHKIPTGEYHKGAPVYWVPIKQIHRSEMRYKHYRRVGKRIQHDPSLDNTNRFRRIIRRGQSHLLPPVSISHMDSLRKAIFGKPNTKEAYLLHDGHHRLTAHQAEGKRYIKAFFNDDIRYKGSSE